MIRRILTRAAGAVLVALMALPVAADPLAKDVFGAMRGPTGGAPQTFGYYSQGCFTGGVQLPESGPSWQAMRLSRNRNWGHPELVGFVIGLSQAAQRIGWQGLYVGDMSQPRGGPMTSGHASHQAGLDADIWMLPPASLSLTAQQREQISSVSVVNKAGTAPTQYWSDAHAALLKAAASDPRVDRIFTDPVVKVLMCQAERGDRRYLAKLRYAPAHTYHFHVRLKCPASSPNCRPHDNSVESLSGNDYGCAEAAQQIRDRINPPKVAPAPNPNYRSPRTYRMSELPSQCQAVAAAR